MGLGDSYCPRYTATYDPFPRSDPIASAKYISLTAAFLFLVVLLAACSGDDKPTAPAGPVVKNVNLSFVDDYLDLDTDSVETVPFSGIPSTGMDFRIAYNSVTDVHSRVFHRPGREIAHLVGRTFASVGAMDADTTTFSASLIDQPFATDRTILVKSETGAVFKLGNPVETSNSADGVTFDYAKIKDAP